MGRIRIAEYEVRSTQAGNQPAAPCSVAVLADLHDGVYGSDTETLLQELERIRPALVLSAGDLVLDGHGRFKAGEALKLMKGAAALCPVYAACGNHETRSRTHPATAERYAEYVRQLDEAGVIRLENAAAYPVIGGLRLGIFGLELERYYFHPGGLRRPTEKLLGAETITQRLGPCPDDCFTILLAHHPLYFRAYAQWGADLTLAGHLHGGIVRLPKLGGVISPDPALFPHYDCGRYRIGTRQMIVSAGLGTHTVPVRVNNPAELVVLTFTGR